MRRMRTGTGASAGAGVNPAAFRRRPVRRLPGSRRGGGGRLLIGAVLVGFALISYCGSKEYNPVTGETQYLSLTPRQEIALGLQAAPEMVHQNGGLYPDREVQEYVDRVGLSLVNRSAARDTDWQYDFHLLANPNTVNAFALPGGQIFITTGLYSKFSTEGQLAGVLGHEIGHVVARHSAQRIAKSKLTEGLAGAVMVASESGGTGQMAAMIGQMINMKYGRDDELESDQLGVRFMADAGYDPRALIGVMQILAEATQGRGQSEFFSTHPSPENRVQRIQEAIRAQFPDGVPTGLIP
jgi:predicted Zn-dependent protease